MKNAIAIVAKNLAKGARIASLRAILRWLSR